MKLEGYLPIGTIVRLKQYEEASEENNIVHMIIGYDGKDKQNEIEGKYVLIMYPFGLVTDNLWFCKEEDIYNIVYEGYTEEPKL